MENATYERWQRYAGRRIGTRQRLRLMLAGLPEHDPRRSAMGAALAQTDTKSRATPSRST